MKDLRSQTGLSQRQFADKFDISVRTLQQWEQGKSKPPEYVVNMLERLLAYEKELKRFDINDYRIPAKTEFKVCITDPFINCEKIYPIQQRKVRELIDDIDQHCNPQRIIIFGSSVTERCHIGSDVDLYVELSEEMNPIKNIHDFEYDFWSNFSVDERLLNEIMTKGVVVYGSGSNPI